MIDVTERKLSQEALSLARDELEQRIEERIRPAAAYGLTFRELTVLSLAAGGSHDSDIASILGISRRTVETHMTNILSKMKARGRTQACVTAQREGIID